jgi:hypothetical protein
MITNSIFSLFHARVAALAFVALVPSETICGRPPQDPPALPLGVDSKPTPGVDPGVVREARGSADAADVLFTRARTLSLPPAELTAVLALTDEHDRSEAAARAALRAFRVELARQVKVGVADMVLLGGAREAAMNALQAHLDDEVSVIDRLHALLIPKERAELVAALRNQSAVRIMPALAPRSPTARMEQLNRMLNLDQNQQRALAKLVTARPPPEPRPIDERESRTARVIERFGDDVFSAQNALSPRGASSPVEAARTRLQNDATVMTQLSPLLRQDQRDKLAAHIEMTPDIEEE